jgi:hypothetical protein
MTDLELTEYLHLTPAEAAIVIPKLSPQRRAVYDRMKQLETDLFLWENGLGPMPGGVLVDFARKAFR